MDSMRWLEELVLDIVRGDLPLSTLKEAGVDFRIVGGPGEARQIQITLKAPFTVAPKPVDLAKGLLAYRNRQEQLRDWAAFVLGASELVDLATLDEWPEGDELLSALWDASFEGILKPDAERVAIALANG
jgi:hypothetical protein